MRFLDENMTLYFCSEALRACLCGVDCVELLKSAKEHTHVSRLTRPERNRRAYLRRLIEDREPVSGQFFRQELENNIDKFLDGLSSDEPDIFDAISVFSQKMIVRNNNRFCYRYEYTDIWRSFSRYADEEIIVVSAALRDRTDRKISVPELDFSYCINCDSTEIMNMLTRDEGTSENHFHLRGSSPYFYIAWIYLMNHVDSIKFEARISDIEKNLLVSRDGANTQGQLTMLWKKAAAIRLYLYCICQSRHGFRLTEWISDENALTGDENSGAQGRGQDELVLNELLKYIFDMRPHGTYDVLLQKKIESCCRFVGYGLSYPNIFRSGDFDDEARFIDYAQMHRNVCGHVNSKYFNLCGERNFLCEALSIAQSDGNEFFKDLFYIYLAIKHRFHQELVQSNDRIGFFNFHEYQDRKDYFIPPSYSVECSIAADTISSIIDDIGVINKVELRISPVDNANRMWRIIRTYDAAIKKALALAHKEDVSISRFFYTLHFTKIADKEFKDNVCRNYLARKRAFKQANAIVEACYYDPSTELDSGRTESVHGRRGSNPISERIWGIDACAEEMDCRPEVFGVVYRFLQWYFPVEINHQIKATYHVAEDNYDIIDAIRAIDEAITFCGLHSGCRLGHATLLGIPAERYYATKGNRVSMPEQNWLDNAVWLYFFIKEGCICFDGCALLLDYLSSEFKKSFRNIYMPEISSGYFRRQFTKRNACEPHFDITSYFLSWLLRGDEPSLYETGFADKRLYLNDKYLYCDSSDKIRAARANDEACYLYYLYHYRASIKEKGARIVMKTLPRYFIEGAARAQKLLCEQIASMGIGIETNPTSNLFISSIKNYSDHPISIFYGNASKNDSRGIKLNISVNTDDKSVFSTSLSNEYTFLLFHLENEYDAKGERVYSRNELLKWLDEIRRMGNEQSFAK